MAFVVRFDNRGMNVVGWPFAVGENNLRADARVFSGTNHRPPIVRRIFFEQQNFKFAPGIGVDAAQSRRNDARIVQHQHVAFAQKFQQIRESPVFDAIFIAMQDQETGFIPFGRGMLRDQFRREIKIKIGGSHRREFPVLSFKFQAVVQRKFFALNSGL